MAKIDDLIDIDGIVDGNGIVFQNSGSFNAGAVASNWGDLAGDISAQNDLSDLLDTRQDNLTGVAVVNLTQDNTNNATSYIELHTETPSNDHEGRLIRWGDFSGTAPENGFEIVNKESATDTKIRMTQNALDVSIGTGIGERVIFGGNGNFDTIGVVLLAPDSEAELGSMRAQGAGGQKHGFHDGTAWKHVAHN